MTNRSLYALSCLAVVLLPFLFNFQSISAVPLSEDKYKVSPVFYDMDCHLWHLYAEKSGARLTHWTDIDNAPYGREVYWASPLYWLILLGSGCASLCSAGDPLLVGCIIVGPLVLAGLILFANAIILAVTRSLKMAAGFNFALAGCKYLFIENYLYRPDHHGLFSSVFCLQCLLLVLGIIKKDKRFFCAAGILAALGCWILTAQAWPLFLLVALAALIDIRAHADRSANWAAWAGCAAAASVCFYLVEYYPELPQRLEINHPVYAVVFLSWSCLFAIFPRVYKKARGLNLLYAALALLPTIFFLAAMIFGPQSIHAMRDPVMFRLHTFIAEFLPPEINILIFPYYMAPSFLAVYALARNRPQWLQERFRPVIFMAVVVLGLTCAALLEFRWLGLFQVATVNLVAAIFFYESVGKHEVVPKSLMTLLLRVLIFCTAIEPLVVPGGRVGPLMDSVVLYRALQPHLAAGSITVLGALDCAPELYAWSDGKIRCVDSSYWENLSGVRAAFDSLAARDPAESIKIFHDRAVDFLALRPGALEHYADIRYGSTDPALVASMTASRIVAGEFPGAKLSEIIRAKNPREEWKIYRLKK